MVQLNNIKYIIAGKNKIFLLIITPHLYFKFKNKLKPKVSHRNEIQLCNKLQSLFQKVSLLDIFQY